MWLATSGLVCSAQQMKVMNSSKEPAETQQSYFYVVWPEDKSPGGDTATTILSSAVPAANSSASAILPSYETITTSSSGSSSSSLQQESPARSPLGKEEIASVQGMPSNNVLRGHGSCTKLAASDGGSDSVNGGMRSAVQHIGAASPCSVATSSTFPQVDTFSSAGRHRSVLAAHDCSPGKQQGGAANSVGESKFREIGAR